MVAGLAVQNERLQLAMSSCNQCPAWSLVNTARLHSHNAIFNAIRAADAVRAGNLIQIFEKLHGPDPVAVQANRNALLEIDRNLAFAFRARAGIHCQHE